MTSRRLAPLLVAAVLLLAGCRERVPVATAPAAAPDVVTLNVSSQQNAGITVAAVNTAMRAEQTEAPGVLALDERRTARIGSLVEGIVLETFVEVGDRVTPKHVLAWMHSPVVHEAWASYRKAIAERRRLEKEVAFAVAAHERAGRLYADKAISLQDVQRAEANRVAAEEMLDMGRTEIRRSEEELEHLGITNAEDPTGESGEQIPVRTPIGGVVLERLVTPGTTVTPGAPLFVVSDLSALWAHVEIDEALLAHVHEGQSIAVRVAAYPAEQFAGTVELVGDTVNPRTRRITVRCAMRNADGRLKPEMYATVVIRQAAARETIVIPSASIQTIGGQPHVFVAEFPDKFRPRAIATGPEADGITEVRSGLQRDERIAVSGTFALKSQLLKTAAGPED